MSHRGEFGSPHISRMEGDLAKIHPLGQQIISNGDALSEDMEGTLDTRDSHAGNAKREATFEHGSSEFCTAYHSAPPTMTPGGNS